MPDATRPADTRWMRVEARGSAASRPSGSTVRLTSATCRCRTIVLAEEGHKPESVFDFVQGVTAVARDKPHQDARLDLEARAKKLLDRAA